MSDRPAPQDSGGSSPASPGIGESATGILSTVLDYIHARLELLALETREAKDALLGRLVCGVVGGFFLLVAYAALCVGAVGWLSKRQGWPWPLTTFGLAGLHLFIAALLLVAVRRRFTQPPFRDSLRELEEDRNWLRRHRKRDRA
ncbi:MAG: phage holin family protein [Verrucomicrobiae bacterium]|nr:phage holin family protein [Verrucomicrobiae bacterium]